MNSEHFSVSFPEKREIHIPEHSAPAQVEKKEDSPRIEEASSEAAPSLAQFEEAERKSAQKQGEEEAEVSALKNIGNALTDQMHEEKDKILSGLKDAADKLVADEQRLVKEESQVALNFDRLTERADAVSDEIELLQTELVEERQFVESLAVTSKKPVPLQFVRDLQLLSQSIANADHDMDEVKEAIAELSEILSGLSEFNHEKVSFNTQREIVQSIIGSTKELSQAMDSQDSAKAAKSIEHLHTDLKRISSLLKPILVDSQAMLKMLQNLEETIEKIEQKIEQSEHDLAKAEGMAQATENDVEGIDVEGQLQAQIAELRDQEKKRKARIEKAQAELSDLKGLAASTKADVQELHRTVESIIEDIDELEEVIVSLDKKIEETERWLMRGRGLKTSEETSEAWKKGFVGMEHQVEAVAPAAIGFEALAFLLTVPQLGIKGREHYRLKQENKSFIGKLSNVNEELGLLAEKIAKLDPNSIEAVTLSAAMARLSERLDPLHTKVEEFQSMQRKLRNEVAQDVVKSGVAAFATAAAITKHATTAHAAGEAASHVAEVGEAVSHTVSGAAVAAGVGLGLVSIVGVALSSKELVENRKISVELSKAWEEVSAQLATATEEGDELLQSILALRLLKIEQMITDNAVSTVKNTLGLTSSVGGVASGTLTVIIAVTALGLTGAAMGTGIGAAVIAGVGLGIGGAYLIYKKRHAIAHAGRSGTMHVKKKVLKTRLKIANHKAEKVRDKVKRTQAKLALSQKESTRTRILVKKRDKLVIEQRETEDQKRRLEEKIKKVKIAINSENEEYKYKRFLGNFSSAVKMEDLMELDRKLQQQTSSEKLYDFLAAEKGKGHMYADPTQLLNPGDKKEDRFLLVMDYITAGVK